MNWEILENHQNPITKFIDYLQTLKKFVYKYLKNFKDKIMNLGPYTFVLRYILSIKTTVINKNKFLF